jgi:hypothetical protein
MMKHLGDGSHDERGDIMLTLEDGCTVADISVVHPACPTYRTVAANDDGAAAKAREKEKCTKYRKAQGTLYKFVPLATESFGRMGPQALALLNALAESAAEGGRVSKAAFISGSLRELSICLCKGNGRIYRGGLSMLARVTGRGFKSGFSHPTAEVA